jgi:flagellar basal body-associated protein FliL
MPPEEKEEKKEEKPEKKEEKKKGLGGLPKILIIVIGIVLVGLISAGIAFKVATSVKPPEIVFKKEEEEEEEKKREEKPPPLHTEEIGEFTVKLADPYEDHFLKIENMVLAYNAIKYKELASELAERRQQIRHIVNLSLADKTSEICTPEGIKLLKKELITQLNNILIHGQIEDIYFTWIYQ